jgi:butyryl-CoA dehydrogenase
MSISDIHSMPQVTDFELSPELEAFRRKAREFAEKEIKPEAKRLDREGMFPTDIVRKAGEQGFLGVTIPEEYGGTMMGSLASCVMLEEFNAACAATGVTVSVHISLFCAPLHKWGTKDQQAQYFPKVVGGRWLGAYCLSEAGSGSDAAALRCEARKDGDDYILNGPKLWVSTGQEASVYIVFARTGEDRVKGITAFLVERGFKGVSVGKKERKLGIRASSTTELLLENVRVPKQNLLGEEGKGFTIALDTLDGGRLGIASQGLGIARASHDLIRDHLAEIKDARGRPAASQAQQYQLADIAAHLDGCRFLTWRAANLRDRGERCSMQSAMAKLCASRLANQAARTSVSILGATGASGASDAERLFRDARITEIYEGVTDIQRLVIARGVLSE